LGLPKDLYPRAGSPELGTHRHPTSLWFSGQYLYFHPYFDRYEYLHPDVFPHDHPFAHTDLEPDDHLDADGDLNADCDAVGYFPAARSRWLDIATGYPNITWIADPSSAVTAYEVWGSTSGLPGSYADLATYAKPAIVDFMSVVDNQSVFNAYFYIVAIGTLPDSAPSRIVHAISGTTTTNALTISVTSSLSPAISVTGSVPGAFMRAYTIPQVPPVYYWVWGDEGSPLTTSVVYGFSGSGLTYVPAAGLPATTNNIPLTIRTYNSQYWNIDTSYTTFNTP
jgi:hypothetical protein